MVGHLLLEVPHPHHPDRPAGHPRPTRPRPVAHPPAPLAGRPATLAPRATPAPAGLAPPGTPPAFRITRHPLAFPRHLCTRICATRHRSLLRFAPGPI